MLNAEAHRSADSTFRFSATFQHGDIGWDHYADRCETPARYGIIIVMRVARPSACRLAAIYPEPVRRSNFSPRLQQSLSGVAIRSMDLVAPNYFWRCSNSRRRSGIKARLENGKAGQLVANRIVKTPLVDDASRPWACQRIE